MNTPFDLRAEKQERWRATFALIGCGAFYLVAALLPDRRLWGINHLAFLPASAWVFFAVALLAGLVAIWRWQDLSRVDMRLPRIPEAALIAGVVIGWVLLTGLARSATPLLGDGYLRADEAERLRPGTFGIQEFLPGLLASAIQQNLPQNWGVSGRDAIAIVGVLAGILLLIGALIVWPRVVVNDSELSVTVCPRRLTALWLLAGGSAALFFGYTESYALSWAVLSLFTLSLLAHRRGRLGWGWSVALWVVAIWSHLAALAWAPALLLETGRDAKSGRRGYLALVVAIGAVAACVVTIWFLKPSRDQLSFQSHLLPFWGAAYSVFDWRHWADAINQMILVAPIALFLLWPSKDSSGDRVSLGDVFLFGPTVAAFLMFNPELSWARDWDLFALFCAPAITVLAVAIARRQRSWPVPRRIAALTVAVSAAALWVWVNANTNASAARFENLLALDPQNAMVGTGRENLARHWREKGRWDLAANELGKALANGPHARLATQRGIAFGAMGMPDSALASFEAAVKADSTDPDGYFGVGQTLWAMGRTNESLPYLNRAVGIDSTRADYRYHLGMTLRDLGRPREAQPHLQFAAMRNPSQPDYAIASAVTLYDLGDYDGAVATISEVINRFPDYNLAYLNMAWVLYRIGKYDQASNALAIFAQRQPSNAQDANPKRLRYLLDSVAAGAKTPLSR